MHKPRAEVWRRRCPNEPPALIQIRREMITEGKVAADRKVEQEFYGERIHARTVCASVVVATIKCPLNCNDNLSPPD
jgi:hypothetical protein